MEILRSLFTSLVGWATQLLSAQAGEDDAGSRRRTLTVVAVLLLVVVVAMLFFSGVVSAQGMTWRVVGAECDKHGAVNQMAILVTEPGLVSVGWDNENVCGKKS